MSSPKRRIETDNVRFPRPIPRHSGDDDKKLIVQDDERLRRHARERQQQEFYVRFKGPSDTPFAGGVWKIHVELPDQYPYKSPSIGFCNRIFHPNVDELSGSVCLDVINQTWSPMFDMVNIFESFLPQLLTYPNASDPLNGEAAALYLRDKKGYEAKVKDYIQRYATSEMALDARDNYESDGEMSSVASFSDDDELAGEMEIDEKR